MKKKKKICFYGIYPALTMFTLTGINLYTGALDISKYFLHLFPMSLDCLQNAVFCKQSNNFQVRHPGKIPKPRNKA